MRLLVFIFFLVTWLTLGVEFPFLQSCIGSFCAGYVMVDIINIIEE